VGNPTQRTGHFGHPRRLGLAGYYLLDCADLDEAVRAAARLPMARYGSIEVRPVMAESELPEVGAAG
jgi:hypothetical protein